jgi:CelD/BcsL family acetyltransferase involved in cellulose biosynthesis
MDIKVEVFDSFSSARDTWSRFQDDGLLYVFQTHEWLENWFLHVGENNGVKPCFVSVLDPEDRPLYFFPFAIERRRGADILSWLGGSLSDYGAPIIGSGATEEHHGRFDEIWAEILKCLPRIDLIWLTRIPARVEDRPNPLCLLKKYRYHSSAHFVELDGSWDDFYQRHAGARTRSTDRRKQRRLSESGDVSCVIAGAEDRPSFERITRAMISQKQSRYREIRAPNILSQARYRGVFTDLTDQLEKSGMIQVSCLTLDEKIITAHWGMVYGNRFYYYMPSFETGPWTRFSPGRLLLFFLFQWCLEHKITIFDFTVGDEAYKKDWCDEELPLYQYLCARSGKGRLFRTYSAARVFLLNNKYVLSAVRKIRRLFN